MHGPISIENILFSQNCDTKTFLGNFTNKIEHSHLASHIVIPVMDGIPAYVAIKPILWILGQFVNNHTIF